MQQRDIRAVYRLFKRNLLPLLISTLVGAILLGACAGLVMKKQYTSQVLMYVSNLANTAEDDAFSYTNLSSSTRLVQTYIEVLENRVTLEQALPQLSQKITAQELAKMLTLRSVEDTALLRVSVTTDNPAFSAEVANVIADMAPDVLKNVIGAGSVKAVGQAKQGVKSAPNEMMMTLMGAFAGLVLMAAIIFIRYTTDKTVKAESDFKQRLDVPVLGVIPHFSHQAAGGKKHA